MHLKFKIKNLKFLLVFVICTAIPLTYAVPPPDGISIITQKEQAELGKKLMQEIRRKAIVIDDPIIYNYIENLGQKLLAHTDSNIKKFHFFVLQDPTINAFSMPGGYIGINSGLIFATRSESELAAVLAHEIAHITQHHIERLLEQVDNINIPATAALMAAILAGASSGSPSAANAATGAAMAVMAGSTQHLLNFTRSNEAEADRIGMKTLHSAGFDPEAMPNFFAQMEHVNLNYDNQIPPYLLTHPVTSARIADSKNRAAAYPKQAIIPSTAYPLVKVRLNVLTVREKTRVASHFKSLLTNNNLSEYTQNAVRYAYALALYENRQFTLAQNNLDPLIKKNGDIIYQLLKAQIEAERNVNAALDLLKTALNSNPHYYPLIMQYAQTLLDNKQAQTAKNLLEKYAPNYSDNPLFQQTLAQAEAQAGALGDAYLSKAKLYELAGYNHQALILLQQALKLPKLSVNTKTKIKVKISQLKADN